MLEVIGSRRKSHSEVAAEAEKEGHAFKQTLHRSKKIQLIL